MLQIPKRLQALKQASKKKKNPRLCTRTMDSCREGGLAVSIYRVHMAEFLENGMDWWWE